MRPPLRPKRREGDPDQSGRNYDNAGHRLIRASGRSADAHAAAPRAARLPSASTSSPDRSPTRLRPIADRAPVARSMKGVDAVLHAATLHKPHVATHARGAFVETNILGTLIPLEEAARARVRAFVMTSTMSAFGDALKPPPDEPAAWIDERGRAGPKEHLRRDQDSGRGPLPIVPPQRKPGVDRAQDLALLSRRGRRSGGAQARMPTTTRRRTNICSAAAIEDVVDAHLACQAERAEAGTGFKNTSSARDYRFRLYPADCARPRVEALDGRHRPARAGMGR